MPKTSKPEIRNRIIDYKQVKPEDLIVSKKNWRQHGTRQQQAMKGILESVGIVGAVLGRAAKGKPGKYEIFDGAMRADLLKQRKTVPLLVTDLSDREMDLLLATYDKIAEYAGHDEDKFGSLIKSLKGNYADIVKMFDVKDLVKLQAQKGAPEYRIVPSFDESYDSVIIFCKTGTDSAALQKLLKLQKSKDRNGRQGIARVISFEDFMKIWKARK